MKVRKFLKNHRLYYIRIPKKDMGDGNAHTITLARWPFIFVLGKKKRYTDFLLDYGTNNPGELFRSPVTWVLRVRKDGACFHETRTGWKRIGSIHKIPA